MNFNGERRERTSRLAGECPEAPSVELSPQGTAENSGTVLQNHDKRGQVEPHMPDS